MDMSTKDGRQGGVKEIGVRANFHKSQARLINAASSFILGVNLEQTEPCFIWDLYMPGEDCAVPDGYFTTKSLSGISGLDLPNCEFDPRITEFIPEYFTCAGVWEFKNLSACTKKHMADIIKLSCLGRHFPWSRCTGCSRHRDKTGQTVVTGACMGFDSDFLKGAHSTIPVTSAKRKMEDAEVDFERGEIRLERGERHCINLLHQVNFSYLSIESPDVTNPFMTFRFGVKWFAET